MKFDELTHEERELVLFIENNKKAYDYVIPKVSRGTVMNAGDMYVKEYATEGDKIFTTTNCENVASYLKKRQD